MKDLLKIWRVSASRSAPFPTPTMRKSTGERPAKRPTGSGLVYSSLPGKSRPRSQRRILKEIRQSEPTWDLRGPAPLQDKLLWQQLALRQVAQRHIPPFLRNDIVSLSPRDSFGRIAVKRMTGLVPSPATSIVRKFEEMLSQGGDPRAEVVEKLRAVEDRLSVEEKAFVELCESAGKQKGLARLMAEAEVRPSRVLKLFADGAIALGKIHSAIEVSRNQPQIVKDLMRNALDQEGVCQTCVGTGVVKQTKKSAEETMKCPSCEGSGHRLRSSKHKEWAMDKVLEIGKLVEKPSSGKGVNVAVQQNVGVSVDKGGGFVERMLKTSDEVLYGRKAIPAEVVDVPPSGGSGEPSKDRE